MHRAHLTILLLVLCLVLAAPVQAAAPVVKTVQFVPDVPTSVHPIVCDLATSLKGVTDTSSGTWKWDPADGFSAPYEGTLNSSNMWGLHQVHTYTAAHGCVPGRIYAAKLSITNAESSPLTTEKVYYMKAYASSAQIKVNIAIDEGLWSLHRNMSRYDSRGDWSTWSGYYGLQGSNLEAFFAMGFKETGTAENPYTDTVQRGMRRFFEMLSVSNIGNQTLGNPDTGGAADGSGGWSAPNGIGISIPQGNQGYQLGMMLSALVASDNPNGVAPTGVGNVVGRTYKAIAWDIADWIFWAQYQDPNYGGWRYTYHEFPDNSACQWNAIALLAAELRWSIPTPAFVKTANANWLTYSHNGGGYYGYTDANPVWGTFAVTGSGLVQAIMDGYGRGDARWNSAETYLRENWDASNYTGPMKTSYYYALFSFTKSMLLHTPPITWLHSETVSGQEDLDWYNAEIGVASPNPPYLVADTNGVAKSLVDGQTINGGVPDRWWYHNPDGNQFPFETAWAIMMLNKTVGAEAGRPVALAKATPSHAMVGQTVTLDGSGSYHQAVGRSIIAYEWTIYNGPTIASPVYATKTGMTPTITFSELKNYMVQLVVKDDATPQASSDPDYFTVLATVPPVPPVANAAGPYEFCNQAVPWILDGSRSVNPDDGRHQEGVSIGDYITAYNWDLDNNGAFNNATGARPDVTAFFSSYAPGSYLVQLQVVDNTAISFPDSGLPNLTSTASATVKFNGNCACTAVKSITAKASAVALSWTNVGATAYRIYRSLSPTSGFSQIASVNAGVYVYTDKTVTNGLRYYYQIKPYSATMEPNEWCTSNQVNIIPPVARTR